MQELAYTKQYQLNTHTILFKTTKNIAYDIYLFFLSPLLINLSLKHQFN